MKLRLLPDILRFIVNHPLNRDQKLRAVLRFFGWQVRSRLFPGPAIVPFVNESRLIIKPGLMGATGVYYTGLYEFEEMGFVLHALRASDGFIDVGANVGAFTLLASAVIGARSLAIEPVPATYQQLLDNVNLNGIASKARCLNIGAGRQAGLLRFTATQGASSHVSRPREAAGQAITVPVQSLDQAAVDFTASILKIDVEGYESEVIAGAEQVLAQASLFAVLLELRGHGSRYGFDENALHQKMLICGFKPYRYHPCERVFEALPGIDRAEGNTLYLRDPELALQRVRSAARFSVNRRMV